MLASFRVDISTWYLTLLKNKNFFYGNSFKLLNIPYLSELSSIIIYKNTIFINNDEYTFLFEIVQNRNFFETVRYFSHNMILSLQFYIFLLYSRTCAHLCYASSSWSFRDLSSQHLRRPHRLLVPSPFLAIVRSTNSFLGVFKSYANPTSAINSMKPVVGFRPYAPSSAAL